MYDNVMTLVWKHYMQENKLKKKTLKMQKDVGMACQKVCKQGIGMMYESKGQYIDKTPSLHLSH